MRIFSRLWSAYLIESNILILEGLETMLETISMWPVHFFFFFLDYISQWSLQWQGHVIDFSQWHVTRGYICYFQAITIKTSNKGSYMLFLLLSGSYRWVWGFKIYIITASLENNLVCIILKIWTLLYPIVLLLYFSSRETCKCALGVFCL